MQTVFAEAQIANHFGAQHAGNIGGGRSAAAGSNFFRNTTSADDFAALQNKRRKSCAREIGCRGQSVMPAADDNRVVNLCLASGLRSQSG